MTCIPLTLIAYILEMVMYRSQVEETNSVVAELVKVTAKERILLQQCEDFLSTLAAMQVSCSYPVLIIEKVNCLRVGFPFILPFWSLSIGERL